MGVFARLFRRSKTTEETRTVEARADGAAAGAGPRDGTAEDDGTGPQDGTGSGDAAGTAEPKGSSGAPETGEPPVRETGQVVGTEAVEIPRQQSSETAAGSEAGEGART